MCSVESKVGAVEDTRMSLIDQHLDHIFQARLLGLKSEDPVGLWSNQNCDVRYGSKAKADMCAAKRHVRFAPESRHVPCTSRCLLCANSGHPTASPDDGPLLNRIDRK